MSEELKAIDFYNANKTNTVNVPRPGHPEDKSGWDGVHQVSGAGSFAKNAPVMSLSDACDFAEKLAAQARQQAVAECAEIANRWGKETWGKMARDSAFRVRDMILNSLTPPPALTKEK